MRLHELTLTAVGPFATTEVIDFDALTRGGLFLLEGPTGAGKSTVLDAITFALFGGTAGEDSSADRLHSDFALPGVTPTVTLDFSARGSRMRIERVPAHERPKQRGEGTTTEKTRVRLERRVGDEWAHVSGNTAEVGSEVQSLLGLNREQFTRVVLLPQGEFARFLRAKDEERRSVLTQIFRTGFYERVTRRLDDDRTEAGRRRRAADESVTKAAAALGAAAGLEGEGALALGEALASGDTHALDDLKAALETSVEETTVVATTAAEAQVAAAAEHSRLADLSTAYADHARYLTELETHAAHEPQQRGDLAELAAARRAAPVAVLLEQLARAHDDCGERRRALEVLGVVTDDASARAEGDARELEARRLETDAAALGPMLVIEQSLEPQRIELETARTRLTELDASLAELDVRHAELPSVIAALETEQQELADRAAQVAAAEADVARASARVAAATTAARLEAQLGGVRDQRLAATTAYLTAKEHHLDLLERHLDGVAAELAAQLVDGEACRVCGSTEHPSPAPGRDDLVGRDEVDLAQQIADAARVAVDEVDAVLQRIELEQASARASAGDLDVEAASEEQRRAAERLASVAAAVPRLAVVRVELADRKRELTSIDDTRRDLQETRASVQATRDASLAALTADEERVTAARGDAESVGARIAALGDAASGARDLSRALLALGDAVELVRAKTGEAERACLEAGFPSLADASAAVRGSGDVEVLAARTQAHDEATTRLATLADDPRFAGLTDGGAADTLEQLDLARAALDEAQRTASTAIEARTIAVTRRDGFVSHHAALVTEQTRRDGVYAETEAIHRLARLATGNAGSRRMTLSTYVLRHWFDSVVQAANLRLTRMSAGRYQLERTEEGESRRDQTGLGLAVLDRHTGDTRSPRSLSGGETFYTSLALALGLADVVRAEAGGVDLDTLFIDEGFGTLDPETLELVMGVIDDLRDGGRAVGIVSHVADLKDRVTERLEVRRTHPQGPSTTHVVA